MKVMLAVLLAVGVVACSRGVQVETGAPPQSSVALQVTNNAAQAVNVYVTTGGNEMFVGQVAPNSTQLLPVSGVASGATVTLRARTVDGGPTYMRENVTLTGTYSWQVP
jgi:hypothetical protein